jgi:hypothetical protein
MQELIAAVVALAGSVVGYWIRSLCVYREKQQLESRLAEFSASLGEMKTELAQAQALASSRAGFESLAAEREKTGARIAAERDALRGDLELRIESERAQSARISGLEAELRKERESAA